MKKWKHINFEQRKTIASGISHNMKVKDLGILLNLHPTGISREVKRNRILVEPIKNNNEICPKLNRWPYVCTNCKKRYFDCPLTNTFIMLKTLKIMPITLWNLQEMVLILIMKKWN